ncbi:CdaR family protein [Clostridium oceanicum]|uniref:CdaR family protein n=1 Tax=Clostridium oceanicum TaxID=1543 RepID=A0ABN1JAV1_9CLOT
MGGKNKNQDMIIRICCIIASFSLWLYIFNIENPIREHKVSVPVQIINQTSAIKSNLAMIPQDNTSINLVLKGNASDIYAANADKFKLEADLSEYGLKKGVNKIPVKVKKKPDNISIVNEENIWIEVKLDELKTKTVDVDIKLTGNNKKTYTSLTPTTKTKRATISGTKSYVDKVKDVVAVCDVTDTSDVIKRNIPLIARGFDGEEVKGVDIKPSFISVEIPVKKVKTVPINVKLNTSLDNNPSIQSILPTLKYVDIAGDEEVINNIKSIDTETIDINSLNNKKKIQSKLVVPQNVTLVNSNGSIELNITFKNGNNSKKPDESNDDKEDNNNKDEIITKNLSLTIKTLNIMQGKEASLDNTKVSISIKGKKSLINTLNSGNVNAYVDLKDKNDGQYTIPINIELPQGVTKISSDIENVKVTIKPQNQEETDDNKNQ